MGASRGEPALSLNLEHSEAAIVGAVASLVRLRYVLGSFSIYSGRNQVFADTVLTRTTAPATARQIDSNPSFFAHDNHSSKKILLNFIVLQSSFSVNKYTGAAENFIHIGALIRL